MSFSAVKAVASHGIGAKPRNVRAGSNSGLFRCGGLRLLTLPTLEWKSGRSGLQGCRSGHPRQTFVGDTPARGCGSPAGTSGKLTRTPFTAGEFRSNGS